VDDDEGKISAEDADVRDDAEMVSDSAMHLGKTLQLVGDNTTHTSFLSMAHDRFSKSTRGRCTRSV
jgi:hypothetical protein